MSMHWKQWAVSAAAVVGLVGCGGEDTYVYDVELDAAALSDVPFTCESGRTGTSGPSDLPAQQRWTLREVEYRGTTLEVPDINYQLGPVHHDPDADDTPDVLRGTTIDQGPFQYLYLDNTDESFEGSGQLVLHYLIQDEELGDTIHGSVSARYDGTDAQTGITDVCTYSVPFTGRRVKE